MFVFVLCFVGLYFSTEQKQNNEESNQTCVDHKKNHPTRAEYISCIFSITLFTALCALLIYEYNKLTNSLKSISSVANSGQSLYKEMNEL
jgi:hypothetical protein